MKVVIQRVLKSSVSVGGNIVGQIDKGFNVLFGVGQNDTEQQADWLAEKIAHLRVFEDENGKMNLSLSDVGGSVLIISQFTLYGDCEKGRRPSFTNAGDPKRANELYQYFSKQFEKYNIPVQNGIFQADMKVEILNDGPVTFIIEAPNPKEKKDIKSEKKENHLGLSEKEWEKFQAEAQMVKRNIALRKKQERKNG